MDDLQINKRPTIRRGERGFTMVELVVASALTTILVIVVSQLIMQTSEMARIMIHRVAINAEARQMFEMAANGVVRDLDPPNGVDAANPNDRIAGFRGAGAVNGGAVGWQVTANQATDSQLVTWHLDNTLSGLAGNHFVRARFNSLTYDYTQDALGLNPTTVSSSGYATITCTGAGNPHPDCGAADTTRTIGYLFNRNVAGGLVNNRLVEIVNANNQEYVAGLAETASGIKAVNLRLQLVDPYYLVEQWQLGNIPYGYPTNPPDVVGAPQDGNGAFFGIPNDYRESYRTSFNMVVDY